MPETASAPRFFAELHTPKARLIRCTDAPDIDSLSPGDMVICEDDDWSTETFVDECAKQGIHVRAGRFRYETERVIHRRTRSGVQADYPDALLRRSPPAAPPGEYGQQEIVDASTAAFAATWDALSADLTPGTYEPATSHVPAEVAEYLPYPTINPAQVQAAPYIMGDKPAMIVAPTGAGKTVIGMMAAAREIKQQGRKAAWLVPQRTLTAELDQDLQKWRDLGVKVVALSGETTMDAKKVREADLWVATTEKFEALCRASSMKEAIAGIGTIIVDEIHLLGEPGRGPILESLLARIRQETSGVRLVGLSATAANADQVAEWLRADLVEITWRPTRLTNQVLTLANGDGRADEERNRNEIAVSLVDETTSGEEGGSALVFCGSKHNVRSTALAIAQSRGVRDAADVNPSDLDAVADACSRAGVGLHYSDWPHKRAAEKEFRDRTINTLVATSTLAAGVNTPARVVIVRDTSIGPQPMEVSMIQQMFGRAGRAGQEPEGWAFLLAQANELGRWRCRLAAGYSIESGILDHLADHLLGEVVQGNVRTLAEAEQWWTSTLAFHQGNQETAAVLQARDYLVQWRFIEAEDGPEGEQTWKASRLGSITSKMMVGVRDAAGIISGIGKVPMPRTSNFAEEALLRTLAESVWALSNAPDAPGGPQARAVRRAIAAHGYVSRLEDARGVSNSRDASPGCEVTFAGMLLLARSPQAFLARGNQVAGIARNLLAAAVHDSSRYLAWLGALGPLGSVPAWASVVAADLAQRVTHYPLRPVRGDGRLLRTAAHVSRDSAATLSSVWRDVHAVGASLPQTWLKRTQIDTPAAVSKNLVALSRQEGNVRAPGATLFEPQPQGTYWRRAPAATGSASALVAAFGGHGDWDASGWLGDFARPQR